MHHVVPRPVVDRAAQAGQDEQRPDRPGHRPDPAGAVVAGLLVGIVFSMTSLFAPDFADLSVFVLMAMILLLKPQGLYGKSGFMG